MARSIDTAFDNSRIKELLERNALAQETMSAERLFAVKEQMEMAEARRLQPYFVRSFSRRHSRGSAVPCIPANQAAGPLFAVTRMRWTR